MSRPKPLDDFKPEESPAFRCLEVLLNSERGNFEAAAHAQLELRRLGWELKPVRGHRTTRQAARRQGGGMSRALHVEAANEVAGRPVRPAGAIGGAGPGQSGLSGPPRGGRGPCRDGEKDRGRPILPSWRPAAPRPDLLSSQPTRRLGIAPHPHPARGSAS
jgi:hypothetical protein